eukprot:m.94654 g.94654  ORF g.94654 m.94654 type:complete len:445 (-) comp26743_c0_seq1:87-1421(-)
MDQQSSSSTNQAQGRTIKIRTRKVSSTTSKVANTVNTGRGHNDNLNTNNDNSNVTTAKMRKRPQRQKLNIKSREFVSSSDDSDAGSIHDLDELPKIILPPNDTKPPIGKNGLYTRWNSVKGEWEETPSNPKTRQQYNVNRPKKRHASSSSSPSQPRVKQDIYYNDSYAAPAHRPPVSQNGDRMWWNRTTKTWDETPPDVYLLAPPLLAHPPDKPSDEHPLQQESQPGGQPPPPPPPLSQTGTFLPPPAQKDARPPPQTSTIALQPSQAHTPSLVTPGENTQINQPPPPEILYTKPPRKNARKDIVCPTCQKKCLSNRDLVLHTNTHLSRDKQVLRFSCEICLMKFTTKQSLTLHQPTHTKERPYKCAVCNKAFSHPKTLRLHKRMHEEPMFSCSECSQKFRHRQLLERHIAGHMRALLPPGKFKVTDKGVIIPIPPTPEGPPPQ